jgi:hypothetical protein
MNGHMISKKVKKAIRFTISSQSFSVSDISYLLLIFVSFDILSLISDKKSELSGVWGRELFESDEKWRMVSKKVNGNELWNLDSSRALGRNDRNYDEIRCLRVILQQKSPIKANPNAIGDNTDEGETIDYGVLRVRSWPDQMRDLTRS